MTKRIIIRRRHRTATQAITLVGSWRSSGQTKAAFCRERGIAPSALLSCLRRVTRYETGSPAPTGFIEVQPLRPESGMSLEIAGGLRVTGLDIQTAAALVTALRAVPA